MGSGHRNGVTGICPAIAMSFLVASLAMAENIVIDAAASHVANSFSPPRALGGAIDRLRSGTGAPSTENRPATREELERNTDTLLTDPVLKEILGAGWQAVTYRQNTELMVEAWHWNERGTWSNAEKQEGYFTGSTEPTEPIRHSWAYPLPHRGFSRGDGNGWSRLTDGDLKSYWKSNPYLTKPFTGEDDALHPQWVMDEQWAVMLVNRDHDNDHTVNVVFADSETKRDRRFSGPVDRIVFGAAEYQWRPEGTGGHADPDGPPSKSVVTGGADTLYQLPKASIVVLRGRIAGS